nr:hypothetical protein [Tanacetum cinerariifolium]
MGSSILSAALPYLALAIDSEFEPFEDPESPVASDTDFVEAFVDLEPFVNHVSPAVSATLDPNDEPLDTVEPPILLLPAFYPQTSHIFPAFVILSGEEPPVRTLFKNFSLRTLTVQTPTKPRSSSPSSTRPPPKRCRVSPNPASPPAALALVLPIIHVEMLPPHKRFTISERIETLKREVMTMITRLAATEIQIDALQRDVIGRDVRETGLEARIKRLEDAGQKR